MHYKQLEVQTANTEWLPQDESRKASILGLQGWKPGLPETWTIFSDHGKREGGDEGEVGEGEEEG